MPGAETPSDIMAASIRAELARRKTPQVRLASVLGVSEVSVSRRLRGVTPFDVNELVLVADFLGINVADLLTAPTPIAS